MRRATTPENAQMPANLRERMLGGAFWVAGTYLDGYCAKTLKRSTRG